MITSLREAFNRNFSTEKYQAFLDYAAAQYQLRPAFRIAETPVFIPEKMLRQLTDACEAIVDELVKPGFLDLSQGALLPGQTVPGETAHPTFLTIDFGVCDDENGELHPQLIEIQGFPSLLFYQDFIAKTYKEFFGLPEGLTHLFGGLTSEAYVEMLRELIVGDCSPEEVILLEIEPLKQTTAIDFVVGKAYLGIPYVCISELIVKGDKVFYKNEKGQLVQVRRIYNRIIFDELMQRADLPRSFDFTHAYDIQWVGHPNWFFRVSKHTLPLLNNPFVPPSFYVDQLEAWPEDLEQYVLKPLFSFAGQGVKIHVKPEDLDGLTDKHNYILQRKVHYQPVIPTPNEPSKAELRMLMIWPDHAARPTLVTNLARLSKGEMIGVRYNKDKDWVGGSAGFFYP